MTQVSANDEIEERMTNSASNSRTRSDSLAMNDLKSRGHLSSPAPHHRSSISSGNEEKSKCSNGNRSLRFEPSDPNIARDRWKRSMNTFRTTSRWSSYRRSMIRRNSRAAAASEFDLDALELAILSKEQQSQNACLYIIPIQIHALIVSIVVVILSFFGIVGSATLLLRNVILRTFASLPPGCIGQSENGSTPFDPLSHVRDERIKRAIRQIVLPDPPSRPNCSGHSTLLYLFGHSQGPFDRELSADFSTYIFINPTLLWSSLCISVLLFWSSINLWSGIWFQRRRRLIPWLLVSGTAVLFMVMASVWLAICNRGWYKLVTLVPTTLGLLFLYWWLIVNNVLEEINKDKKEERGYDEPGGQAARNGGPEDCGQRLITNV